MARLVKKTAKSPVLVGDKKICMCGLSENQPFCDKSHLKTSDEEEGKLYWYRDGVREEIDMDEEKCPGCTGNCCHEGE